MPLWVKMAQARLGDAGLMSAGYLPYLFPEEEMRGRELDAASIVTFRQAPRRA